jgi:hypothetical protein
MAASLRENTFRKILGSCQDYFRGEVVVSIIEAVIAKVCVG